MPQIDLTVSISVILALVATVSPILTSIINNMHHTKIRKLELKQEHPDMINIHDLMKKFDWDAATPLFEELIPKIHDYLQEL